MPSLNTDLEPRRSKIAIEIGQTPLIVEDELELRAADHAAPRQHDERDGGSFDQPLQTIPVRLRNTPQLVRRVQHQIEHNQRKIPITQQQIARFDCFARLMATDPEQMAQTSVARRCRIKRITSIHQREK